MNSKEKIIKSLFKDFKEKKAYLDDHFYNTGKQGTDFEVCYMDKERDIKSKWRKWSKIGFDVEDKENQKWVFLANNITILKNEVVLDLEEPKKYKKILKQLKEDKVYFKAFKTGSKGYHFHLIFNKDLNSDEKLDIIKKYNCDTQKASDRCMIAMPFVSHWKTGRPKVLIEENDGVNTLKKLPKRKKEEIKLASLKSINVISSKIIKTRVLIADITAGTHLIKGYETECVSCGKCKNTLSKTEKKCDCNGKLKFKEITDTGYWCGAYDPKDSGSAPQFSTIFFSNSIIPENPKERELFETDIQTKPIIIKGKIGTIPSNKKIIEWFIDVLDYEFEEKKVDVDLNKLYKFKNIRRDDTFFQKNFCPFVYSKNLIKKIYAITLLSPLKATLPNGSVIHCVNNTMESGDAGQSKTVLFNETLKYCEEVNNAKKIDVENATNRGIIGAVVKNPNTGQYMVKVGKLTLCDGGFAGLDGYGKLSQEDFAELRSIQEEHRFQINKAGGMNKDCAVRMVCLSNIVNKVEEYNTKHSASFDISATTLDRTGKFSGADRRRFAHIFISGNEDTSALEINKHQYLKGYDQEYDEELKIYWNNLREFAWSLKIDDFEWEEGIIERVIELVNLLRVDYKNFSLDYGVLSKNLKIFLSQLPGVAILHESIEKNKVMIKKEHLNWLYELYREEFKELGLDSEDEKIEYYTSNAKEIIRNASPKLKEVLRLIRKYGSQSAVEKAKIMSRKSIWRTLNEVVTYKIDLVGCGKESEKTIHYCCNVGSGKLLENNFGKPVIEESDWLLSQLMKQDGTLTQFGKILLKECNDTLAPLDTLNKSKDDKNISDTLAPLDTPKKNMCGNIDNTDNTLDNTLDNNICVSSELSETLTRENENLNVPLKKEVSKIPNKPIEDITKEEFKCLENIDNLVILKDEKPTNLNLKKDQIYDKSVFGDNADNLLKILLENNKLKLIEKRAIR